MHSPTIFITYNSNSPSDQTLALRLHAIGAVNGFRMLLPDRSNSNTILDSETKTRINIADYFVLFSSVNMSKIVQDEIAYAFTQWHDKSKIIVVYDKAVGGKNLINTNQCTEILIDTRNEPLDMITTHIIKAINIQQNLTIKKLEQENKNNNELVTFLGIGAGLLLLNALTSKSR